MKIKIFHFNQGKLLNFRRNNFFSKYLKRIKLYRNFVSEIRNLTLLLKMFLQIVKENFSTIDKLFSRDIQIYADFSNHLKITAVQNAKIIITIRKMLIKTNDSMY